MSAAYPPGHPDHNEDAFEALDGLYDGTLMGPLHLCSTVAWDGHRTVAAVLVQDTEGRPPQGGPWISEAFRYPGTRYAGLGALLLRCVISRAGDAGLTALGLSVTDSNPAKAVYERLGFHRTATWADLEFPAPATKSVDVPG
ncbi:GNAT family N-acetyltransferase [Nocardia brasiliensis]|uniref:GNAT family N-acetyltransferase n=1 Tax=Nocardia brasiliensis TaxID=37326 RepID=UPI000318B649|nr:GNAT family N-acetyltransferase [Nocardia brasiliensis]ASF12208.1 N-acetyltransferase [Nocardia brasiliensis]